MNRLLPTRLWAAAAMQEADRQVFREHALACIYFVCYKVFREHALACIYLSRVVQQ